jgi:hypothetical protein
MAGTEGGGIPSCGSLVSKAEPAYEASGMDGATPAGKETGASVGCARKNSLAMRANTATSGSEAAWPMLFSSTGSLSLNPAAKSSALF